MSFFSNLEERAKYYNDLYKIGVIGSRGNGELRDAFRHAFTTAEIKRSLIAAGMNENEAAWQAFHLSVIVEMANSNNYIKEFGEKPVIQSINDLNMDLWNNAKGSMIISSSEADSAAKVKALLDKQDLITDNTKSDSRSIDQLQIPGTNNQYSDDSNVAIVEAIRYITIKAIPQALSLLNQLWDSVADFFASAAGVVDSDISEGIDGMWIHASPIALDINKSGAIETISLANSKTYFDIDNDNFTEKLQWISPADGWLAIDRNGNGKIDNQTELFGDNGGTTAYQKLAALNTNNTGSSANRITSADSAWGSLRVWIDANSNGVSEASELRTLSSLGITSLSLESAPGSLKSTFVRDGVTYNAQDIFLQTNQMDSWYKGTAAEIKPEALNLPLSRGYGEVKSLHYAVSASTSLMSKVQGLKSMPISGLDSWYPKLEAMIEDWTSTTTIARNSVNPFVDARQIAIMEKFSGMGAGSYMNSFDGTTLGTPGFFDSLREGYTQLMSEFSSRFIAQGPLAQVFGNPVYSFGQDKLIFTLTSSQILANAKASAPADMFDKNVFWSEIARTLLDYSSEFGTTTTAMQSAINTAAGYSVSVSVPWHDRHDVINGDSGANRIDAGTGNDTVSGGDGNDTIIGGAGSDLLYGGNGDDSLSEAAGSAVTTDYNAIYGDAGNDIITGGTASGLFYGGTGNDTINGGAGNETIYGGDGQDRLAGNGGANILYGDAGNDTLFGGSGNATLIGGKGNDAFTGSSGSETYRYTLGDGNDTISKASVTSGTDVLELTNLLRSGVTFSATIDYVTSAQTPQEPNSVRLGFSDGGSILLAKYLDANTTGRITSVRFSDGSTMTAAQIVQAAALMGTNNNDTVHGTANADMILGAAGNDALPGNAGNDTIFGQAGNDILRGGTGNDLLIGGGDADTYRYVRNDGNDTIHDYDGNAGTLDILSLENIARSEVSFVSVDTDANGSMDSVTIMINGGGSILLQQQLPLSPYYTLDSVRFSDGVVMNAAQIVAATSVTGGSGTPPITGTSGNDTLFGDSNANVINAGAGADEVIGGAGNDALNGDDGNDRIWGEDGNDTINGGNDQDELIGGNGTDSLLGGSGNDILFGEADNDRLNGGAGKDQMTGGAGIDIFAFSNNADSTKTNPDFIWDFDASNEKISVAGLGYTSLDTDGGNTEAGELRFYTSGSSTIITSDQTNFAVQLNGIFTSATLTNSDFIWT